MGKEITKKEVEKHIWPHIDTRKSQTSAGFLGISHLNHGDNVEVFSPLDGKVIKGVFRLLDKDLDKEWLKKAIPIAKELHKQKTAQFEHH